MIEQTNTTAWFGIYSVIQAGTELRKMTPEKIREAIARDPDKFAASQFDPDKPVEMPVIQLNAPSDADAKILANVK